MREWITGVLAFLVAVSFISPWPDGALAPRWIVLSLAVPILLCCVGSIRASIGLYLLTGFVLYSGLSLLWSPSLLDGLYIYWGFLLFLGIFCLPGVPRVAYLGAAIGLIPNTALTIAQYFGVEWVNQMTLNSGLFFNKSMGAEISAMTAIGLAGTHFWFLVPFVAASLFVTPLSRGPIIALSVSVFAYVFTKNRFYSLLLAALLVGVAIRLVLNAPHLPSNFERVAIWADTVRGLTFFGHGLGSFTWQWPYFEHAHNDLLQMAYELGAPGVLLLCSFFGYCLWAGALTERLVLLAFLVEGLFGFTIFNPAAGGLAFLVAGSLCRARVGALSVSDWWQRDRGARASRDQSHGDGRAVSAAG